MPTSQEVTRKPGDMKKEKKKKKPTAKDLPGDGMARQAGNAIESRRAKQKEIMRSIFGGN